MIDSQILAFVGIAAILTITPGADTMLVMRSVLARGQRSGLLTTFGIGFGLFIHAILSALGLSWFLLRSVTLFETIKLLGACYLIFLGSQSLWNVFRSRRVDQLVQTQNQTATKRAGLKKSFVEGMLNNVLNPKVAVFYLAFLPQFINPNDRVLAKSLLLAAIHFVMGLVWLSALTFLLGKIRTLLIRPSVKLTLEAVTGTVLIGFGLRLATHRN